MRRPVVGVIGNAHRIEDRFTTQMVGERNLRAVVEVCGALPLMFAGSPEITDIGTLLDVVDGVVLTGARANVHPTRFNTEPHERHEPYDIHRDDVALALSEACVARGVPLFGICRGLQEMNVAFGGSLHPEIREIPGRMNHRMPRWENGAIHPDPTGVFADRTFAFEMRTPPMSHFLKQAAKIQSGSKAPGRDKAGKVTKAQVREIAEKKMKDLNCDTIESAMKMVEGSARSMGLEVAG